MDTLTDYRIFSEHMSTLRETSLDDSGKSLTESELEAVNFDEVNKSYSKELKLSTIPCSNDALLDLGNGRFVFVEFKNCKVDGYNIRKKIYDSIIIFSDITRKTASSMRECMDYILVYNEEKNLEKTINPEEVQPSAGLNQIAKKTSVLGKKKFIRYGVDIFEKYCFKEVHTYTETEFAEYLKKTGLEA